jgi:signal transduction histidine kinase
MANTPQPDINNLRADRLRYVNELSAGLAHELNQPLSGISMFAENILYSLKEKLPLSDHELEHSMTRIVEQTERISKLITHIRQFSNENERKEVMPVDVTHVIHSIIQITKTQLTSHNIEFDIISQETETYQVSANPFVLEEVIFNILSNARDALDAVEDSQPKSLTIELSKVRGYCEVTITDSGCGMDKDTLDKVFDPFFTTKGPDRGIGLGLPVVKSAIEGFGGKVDIRSQLDQGTTVILFLPELTVSAT